MTMSAAEEFKKHLIEFSDLHSQMGSTHEKTDASENSTENDSTKDEKKEKDVKDNDSLIRSETFIKDRKRYYMDLKENQRGRFLRVST